MVFNVNRNIFPNFNEGFEPESEEVCPICEIVDAYSHQITNVNSHEELKYILHGMVEGAFQDGYTAALQDDVEIKSDLLNEMYKGL